ncbi:MAG: helix-turn-helix domain-containing protein [Proteobacteria bacterium]|nr:helix-turn-helix domain-containing protein [Pseudomonadota bacterium]
MKSSHLSARVKDLRKQKGMSQEILAEESGLSLRTVQRIENGESNPTGDTLKRLSNALQVNPDELVDWTIKEDKEYLIFLNLSALSFIFFPLLGILVPFIMWTSKKDKIINVNKAGIDLINFEITWTIMLILIPFSLFLFTKSGLLENLTFSTFIIVSMMMYFLNIVFIIFNTFRISNKKEVVYFSFIRFLR